MILNFLKIDKESIITSILELLGIAWWIKITTNNPCCTYYFGPFASAEEAQLHQPGYIEDLEQEDAKIMAVDLKQCRPKTLTTCEIELPKKLTSVGG